MTNELLVSIGIAVVAAAVLFAWLMRSRYVARLREPSQTLSPASAEPTFRGSTESSCLEPVHGSDVECTIFAPKTAGAGETVLIQAVLHASGDDQKAREMALAADASAETRVGTALDADLKPGDRIEIRLQSEGLVVDEPVVVVRWRERPVMATFLASVKAGTANRVFARATLLLAGVPVGAATFSIGVDAQASEATAEMPLARYRRVFVSYASADRIEVLKHCLILHRVGLDVYQDLLSIDPGERWERSLYRNIDESDLFLLYWSSASAGSDWVRKEAEYALQQQQKNGGKRPDIVPVLLEGPPPPRPPASLSAIHFNDPLRYIIAAEQAVVASAQPKTGLPASP